MATTACALYYTDQREYTMMITCSNITAIYKNDVIRQMENRFEIILLP